MPADKKKKKKEKEIRAPEYSYYFVFILNETMTCIIEQKYMPHHNLIIAVIAPWRTNRYIVQAKGNAERGTEV